MGSLDDFNFVGGLGKAGAEIEVSVVVLDFDVTHGDSFHLWNGDTSSELGVDVINEFLDEGSELRDEGSGVNSESGALNGDLANAVGVDLSEKFAV